jgi:beta-glucosidase
MLGRTYRYFKGDPLYPFGFGLSYTKFKYDNLKLSANRINAGDELKITAEVRNIGDTAGDEVVQLYVTDVSATVTVPIRSLAGVKRLFLKPGEKQNVSFVLTGEQMSIVDDGGKRLIEPGDFLIGIGGKQPGSSERQGAQSTGVVTARFAVTGRVVEIRP